MTVLCLGIGPFKVLFFKLNTTVETILNALSDIKTRITSEIIIYLLLRSFLKIFKMLHNSLQHSQMQFINEF